MGEPFRPNRFVEITRQLERKLKALEGYAGEVRPDPHSRSMTNASALARLRGGTVGVPAAEAFVVARECLLA
jgi:hypothetical protein